MNLKHVSKKNLYTLLPKFRCQFRSFISRERLMSESILMLLVMGCMTRRLNCVKKNGEKENDVRATKETLKNERVMQKEMQRQPWYSRSVGV